jgi:hypothetical protein
MDHKQPSNPRPPLQEWSPLASSPSSTAARKRARDKGLAWVSAITLGAGAASAIGVAASLRGHPAQPHRGDGDYCLVGEHID